MDAFLYAELRQRELLAESERARTGRLVALARRCSDAARPGRGRHMIAAVTGLPLAPVAC